MGKSNVLASQWLKLYFNATPIPDLADNDATSPATALTVALHTADPGEAGTMATSEAAYTGYARVTVVRSASGWVVAGGDPDPATVSPAANIDFGECTASPGAPITHFSVGSGVGNNMGYHGVISPNITMATGVVPRLKPSTTITED